MKKVKFYNLLIFAALSLTATWIISGSSRELPRAIYSDAPLKSKADLELMMLRDPKTGKIPDGIRSAELEYARTNPGSLYSMKKAGLKTLGNTWNKRGPYEIGGRTRALAVDVTNENIIIAGAVSGGIWRSEDGGSTWKLTNRPDQLKSVSCIAQDKRKGKENNWYAGTGELWGNSADISGDGVYKSTDGGKSWEILPSTSTGNPNTWDSRYDYIWNIAINPTAPLDKDEIYVATALGGISKSTDGGNTWKSVLGGLGNNYSLFIDLVVSNKGIFYATLSQVAGGQGTSTLKGIYRSTDGDNWKVINPDFMPENYRRIVVGIAPSDENQVYFFGETPGSGKDGLNAYGEVIWHSFWKYTYLSGDGSGAGGNWENRSQNLPKPPSYRGHVNAQGSYNLVCTVHPTNPDIVFLGATNIYRTDDAFKTDAFTWMGGYCPYPENECANPYGYPNHHADIHAIMFMPSDPDILLSGSDGGVHKTLDPLASTVEWISLNNGFITTQFYSCSIDKSKAGSQKLIGGTQDNGTLYTATETLSQNWTSPSGGDGLSCMIQDGTNFVYASQNNARGPGKVKIFRILLDEQGKNLVKTRIDPDKGYDFLWNSFFGLDPNDQSRMFLAGGHVIWRNNALEDIPNENSNDSTAIGWDSLYNTRIDPATNPIVKKSGWIYSGAISKIPANRLYYGTTAGEVFRLDNANEGDPVPVNITSPSFPADGFVASIAVDPEDGNKVIVAFSNYSVLSLFYSSDAGNSWTAVSGNLEENKSGTGRGPAVMWVSIMKYQNKTVYFAGTSTGLYATAYLNGEYTVWQQEGAETIGNTVIKMIDVRNLDGYVVAGTHGMGIFGTYFTSFPAIPASPELVYPSNGSGAVLDTLTFKWSNVSGASFYKLELSEDPDFTSLIKVTNGLKTNQYYFTDLEQGRKKFYWRVTAFGAGGESGPSAEYAFYSAIDPPELVWPDHAGNIDKNSVDLLWIEVPDAQFYHIVASTKISFNDIVLDSTVNGSNFLFENLAPNQKYYWKVAASDEYGQGNFSKSRYFRTGDFTSVQADARTGDEVGLIGGNKILVDQNKKINLIVYDAAYYKINIIDVNGRKLSADLSSYYGQGMHSLDIGKLSPGQYFIVIESPARSYKYSFLYVE